MPRLPRTLNVVCRQRVSVDAAKFIEHFGVTHEEIPDRVREYMVWLALESQAAKAGAIIGARRDRL